MRSCYALGPMRAGQILRAFALVNAVGSHLKLERWKLIAEQGHRAIIVVADGAGYVRGLTLSSAVIHPIAGRLMDVPIFIAASAADEGGIARMLFHDVKRRAALLGCDFLRIWTVTPATIDSLDDFSYFDRWDHGLMYVVERNAIRLIGETKPDRYS